MAQVGQTTPSGGREWGIGPSLSACRQVTVPVNCTLNHIGFWAREQTAANANSVKGAVYTSGALLLHETSVLANAITSNVTFSEYHLEFADEPISAGTVLIISISASGTNGNVVVQGQNDSTGNPTYQNPEDPVFLYPNFPADASTFTRTDAGRQWDIYLDYTEVAAGSSIAAISQFYKRLRQG